jgi:hypothetical protein
MTAIRWRLQWRAFVRHYELVAREPGKDTFVVRGGEAFWHEPDLAKGAKYKIELVGNEERAELIHYKYSGSADSWRHQGSWFISRCERTPNPYDPEHEYGPHEESDADS